MRNYQNLENLKEKKWEIHHDKTYKAVINICRRFEKENYKEIWKLCKQADSL